jgi:hypothetical protein
MEDFQALWFLEIHRDRALVSIHREKVRRFWGRWYVIFGAFSDNGAAGGLQDPIGL